MTRFGGRAPFEVSDELGQTRTFEDSQVRVEQIMDQKDLVDERQQNIREIADMMTKVNQISKEMNTLIHKQDEQLDEIHKRQDNVQDNARTALDDMVQTETLTRKKFKKIALWAVAVILLGLCVVGLVYIIKGGSKDEDNKTDQSSLKIHGLDGVNMVPDFYAEEMSDESIGQGGEWRDGWPQVEGLREVKTSVI